MTRSVPARYTADGATSLPDRTTDNDRFPSRKAMLLAARAMRAAGDVRGFIHLIELWRSVGDIPDDLQLHQVSALLDLCQTDRAWVRLKDLVEQQEPSADSLKLAARMFIQRGWPSRARRPLDALAERAPQDPELAELLDAASLPIPHLEEPPAGSTSVGLLLPLAQSYLSQGIQLKGQAILERLRRAHPDNTRVADLLWALDTDWTLGGPDLAGLLVNQDTATPVSPRAEFDYDDEAEPTFIDLGGNSVTLIDDDSDDDSDFSFPALFRGTDALPIKADTPISPPRRSLFDDVTQSTNLADLEALNSAVGAARRAAGIVGGDEFTEIRRIIRRPDGRLSLDESLNANTIPDAHFRTSTPSTPHHTAGKLDVDVEAEDDALIVVTKRERDETEIELLELDANTEAVAHPDAARFRAEAEELDRKAEEEALQEQKRAEREAKIAEAKAKRRVADSAPFGLTLPWVFAIGALLIAVCMLFGLLLVLYQVV